MKTITFFVALCLSMFAYAADVYNVSFNGDGNTIVATDHENNGQTTLFWFIPAPGTDDNTYLIQIRNAPDSPQVKYDAYIEDENGNVIAHYPNTYFPSFYLTVGKELKMGYTYFLYVTKTTVNSVRKHDNKQVLIQRTN